MSHGAYPHNPSRRASDPPETDADLSAPEGESPLSILQAGIEDSDRNPLICDWMSAHFEDYCDPTKPRTTEHGQPLVHARGIKVFCLPPRVLLEANLRETHQFHSDSKDRVFTDVGNLLDPEVIVNQSHGGVSGFTLDSNGIVRACRMGTPLQCKDVHFLICPEEWSNGDMARIIQPLKLHNGRAIVPFVGDLYLRGEPLSGEVSDQLGLNFVAYGPSELLTYPVFLSGGRSVLIPGHFPLVVRPTDEGGYELFTDPHEAIRLVQEHGEEGDGTFTVLHGIAAQYIGTGTRRILYSDRPKNADGTVSLDEDEFIVRFDDYPENSNVVFVQKRSIAGKSGLPVDVRHQQNGLAPTGGMSTAQLSLERDALFLRHGLRMSGVTVATALLIRKALLDQALGEDSKMPVEEIEIALRIILDDTPSPQFPPRRRVSQRRSESIVLSIW